MGLREKVQKEIEKKQEEVRGLEGQILECNAYIQACQDTLKMIPKDQEPSSTEVTLRHGSLVAKARDVIRSAGKPLHVGEILAAMGKPEGKKNRLGLSGSLSAYVRDGKIFTRPGPNVFGLIELSENGSNKRSGELSTPLNVGAEKVGSDAQKSEDRLG